MLKMAAAGVDPTTTAKNSNRRLHPNSLPVIDLRLLSQPDLLALASSASSVSNPQNDAVAPPAPRIDKSVFNESAGSRRQTFFRLRLASPRAHPSPPSPKPQPLLDEDNSRIVPLLKSLFGSSASSSPAPDQGEEEEAGTGRYDEDEIRVNYGTDLGGFDTLFPVPILYQDHPRLRPSSDEDLRRVTIGLVSGETKERRKRGRAPCKDGDVALKKSKVREEDREVESNVDREGNCEVVLGLEAKEEDPYQEELERRTKGMRMEAELVEFLQGVGGEWAGKGRKRKVVEAAALGEWLPSGWRITLSFMKRVSFSWLTCLHYISPGGQQFASYKEASSYLDSFSGPHGASQLSNAHHSDHSGELANKLPNGSVEDDQHWHSGNWYSAVPVASRTAASKEEAITLSVDHEHCTRKRKYGCHKCMTSYDEPDDLLQHLLSSHQRTRKRPRPETSMAEELVVKNGNYECQFCNKTYEERHRFYGHLGNHIKDYVKRLSASAGVATVQKSIELSTTGIPYDITEITEPMGADHSVVMTRSCLSNNEINSSVHYRVSERNGSVSIYGGNRAKSCDSDNHKVEVENEVASKIPSGCNVCAGDVLSSLCAGNGEESSELAFSKCMGLGYAEIVKEETTSPIISPQSAKSDREDFVDNNMNQESLGELELSDQAKGLGICMSAKNSEETFGYEVKKHTILPESKEDRNSKGSRAGYQDDLVPTPRNNCKSVVNFKEQISSESCLVASSDDRKSYGPRGDEPGHLTSSKSFSLCNRSVKASDDLRCFGNIMETSAFADNNAQPSEDSMTFDELESTYGSCPVVPLSNEQMFYFDISTNGPAKCAIRKPHQERKFESHYENELAFASNCNVFELADHMMELCRHEGEVPSSKMHEFSYGHSLGGRSPHDMELQRSCKNPSVTPSTNDQPLSLNNYDFCGITVGDCKDGSEPNRGIPGMVQEEPCLGNMDPGNNNLMIGLNSHIQINEDTNSRYMWKTNEEYDLLGRVDSVSAELVQPSVSFAPCDIQSNKGESELSREKFENISCFEDLKLGSMGNTYCDVKSYSKESNLFPYDVEIGQGFDSSFWLE